MPGASLPVMINPQLSRVCMSPVARSAANRTQSPLGSMPLNALSNAVEASESRTVVGLMLRPSGFHEPVRAPESGVE